MRKFNKIFGILFICLCLLTSLCACYIDLSDNDFGNIQGNNNNNSNNNDNNDSEETENGENDENDDMTDTGTPVSSEGLYFALNEGGQSYTLVNATECTAEEVFITTYNDMPVTAITEGVFAGNTTMKKLTLGDSIEKLGEVFTANMNLTEVTIGA